MIRIVTYIFLMWLLGPITAQAQLVLDVQKISQVEGQLSRDKLKEDDKFGRSIVSLGDLNGDGIGDLAVGAIGGSGAKADEGGVWILFMNNLGLVKASKQIRSLEEGFSGELVNGDQFGSSLANIGDLNGDGVPEIAVGASGDDTGGTDRGALWILFLNQDGTVKQSQKIASSVGGFDGELEDIDRFGSAVEHIGDLNNDGITELIVGADGMQDPRSSNNRVRKTGSAWVLFLTSQGTVENAQKISNEMGGFTGVLDIDDGFGASVEVLQPAYGNGQAVVAVGSPRDDDGPDADESILELWSGLGIDIKCSRYSRADSKTQQ